MRRTSGRNLYSISVMSALQWYAWIGFETDGWVKSLQYCNANGVTGWWGSFSGAPVTLAGTGRDGDDGRLSWSRWPIGGQVGLRSWRQELRALAERRPQRRQELRRRPDGRWVWQYSNCCLSQPIDVSFRPFPLHARPAPASVAVALVASTVPAALSPITVTEIEGVATRIPAVAFVVPPFSSRIRIVHGKVPS